MNTSAISRRSATWQATRVIALVIVLCLSAALGLIVGTTLKGDTASEAQATVERSSVAAGAPTYADPYRAYANAAADNATDASATRPTPR